MKRAIILVYILVFTLVIFNTAFAATLEDPVFDMIISTFNSQGVVSFNIYTSYTVDSITLSSCVLQKKVNNNWVTVTSSYTLTDVYFEGDYWHANVDFSGSITSGQYRVKFRPTADGHTITRYSNSRTF